MNYNKLKYFYEISKIKNFSKASKVLYVSQSSLSKTISDLEDDFGNKLFYRSNRDLTLTPAGEELLKNIDFFFSEENTIYNKVRSIENSNPINVISEIKIGYSPTEVGLGIKQFQKEFQKKYPGIRVLSKRLNKLDILDGLKNQDIDLACATLGKEDISSTMDIKVIIDSHLVIIIDDSHPFAKKEKIFFEDLKNEKLILLGQNSSYQEYGDFMNWFKKNDFYPNIINVFDHVEVLLLQVQNSDHLTILSNKSPYKSYKNLVAVPIENTVTVHNCFIWHKKFKTQDISLFIKEYNDWYLENYSE